MRPKWASRSRRRRSSRSCGSKSASSRDRSAWRSCSICVTVTVRSCSLSSRPSAWLRYATSPRRWSSPKASCGRSTTGSRGETAASPNCSASRGNRSSIFERRRAHGWRGARAGERMTTMEQRAAALLRGLTEDDDTLHLGYERLAAFVDGSCTRDERRDVLHHLSECATCAADVRDLRDTAEHTAPR